MEKLQEKGVCFITGDSEMPIHIYCQLTVLIFYINGNKVDMPEVNTTRYGLGSFRYEAARLWSSLPNDIRLAESYRDFQRLLHNWDFSYLLILFVQQYTCEYTTYNTMTTMENESLSEGTTEQKSEHLCICKQETQKLCLEMEESGEESLFVSVNVSSKAVTYLGSNIGKKFLMERLDIVDSFYTYCNDSYKALLSEVKKSVNLRKPAEVLVKKSCIKRNNIPKSGACLPNKFVVHSSRPDRSAGSPKLSPIISPDHSPSKVQFKPLDMQELQTYPPIKTSHHSTNTVQLKSFLRTGQSNGSPEKLLEDLSNKTIQLESKKVIDLASSETNTSETEEEPGLIDSQVSKKNSEEELLDKESETTTSNESPDGLNDRELSNTTWSTDGNCSISIIHGESGECQLQNECRKMETEKNSDNDNFNEKLICHSEILHEGILTKSSFSDPTCKDETQVKFNDKKINEGKIMFPDKTDIDMVIGSNTDGDVISGSNTNTDVISGSNTDTDVISCSNTYTDVISGSNTDADVISGSKSDTESDVISGSNTYTDVISGSNTDTGVISGSNTDTDVISGSNSYTDVNSGSNTDTGVISGSNTDTDVISCSNTYTDVNSGSNTDTGVISGSNTDTDVISCSNTYTDVNSGSNTDTGVISGSNTDTDVISGSNTDTGVISCSNTYTDVNSGSNTDTDVNSGSNTDTGVISGSNTDTGVISGSNTDTGVISGSNTYTDVNSGSNTDTDVISGSKSDTDEISGSKSDTDVISGSKSDTDEISGSKSDTDVISCSNTDTDVISGSNTDTGVISGSNTDTDVISCSNTDTDVISCSNTDTDVISGSNTDTDVISGSNTDTDVISGSKSDTDVISCSNTDTDVISGSNTDADVISGNPYVRNSLKEKIKTAVVILERLVLPCNTVNDNLYSFKVIGNKVRVIVNNPGCTESESTDTGARAHVSKCGNTKRLKIPTLLKENKKYTNDTKNHNDGDVCQSNPENGNERKFIEGESETQNKTYLFESDPENQNEGQMCESDPENQNKKEIHHNKCNNQNKCPADTIITNKVEFVYKCDVCDRTEKSQKSMLLHKLSHVDNNPLKCTCVKCRADFESTHDLENHCKSVHSQHTHWVCHICGFICNNKLKFQNHQFSSHCGKNPFKCEFCDKSFSQEPYLNKHLYIHMKDKPFKCKECGKQFASKSNYTIHEKTHSGVSYPCDVCGKVFKADERLKAHKKIHTAILPYVCKVCGKKFKLRYYLHCHLQIHESAEGHVCDTCGALCKTRKYLAIHKQIHRKDIFYKCQKCKKEFYTMRKLNLHLKLHTDGKRPHICEICGAAFKVELYLNRHKKIHLGLTFDCRICDGSFSSSASLKRHLKLCNVPSFKLELSQPTYTGLNYKVTETRQSMNGNMKEEQNTNEEEFELKLFKT
ncbi:hypothetical protein KUTeg_010530 [Tegillarca granosa]|uniref:C2H2-type domain-containing protein n=1 Tax=Tegillarca granosa TaxID=220873 RepID=A0ABQ9F8G4_TEGGR|nr:hypothetical protein KUTeg_010530 [Tegillarca granosa]